MAKNRVAHMISKRISKRTALLIMVSTMTVILGLFAWLSKQLSTGAFIAAGMVFFFFTLVLEAFQRRK